MAQPEELHVPREFRRSGRRGEDAQIASARWLISHMCAHLGLADLGESDVLDFGCGVKFTQALIKYKLPIKRYVGIDVEPRMIAFLQQRVADGRFEYHHFDARNELYNPDGTTLVETARLPIEAQNFDVICLFSVFTHLGPEDAGAMLKLLRRFIKPDGRLFFTLYIDELTDDGHGLMDAWHRRFNDRPAAEIARVADEYPEMFGPIETFRDLDPTRPLTWAVYSEKYVRELIESSGWHALDLSPPDEYIQHHFTCAPI
jgi:SAM-dependent methyltransferase